MPTRKAHPLACVFGCAGPKLTAEERRFFAEADPLGFILFARNIETPDQVRRLVSDLRDAVGRADAPVLIDQEGGRVARLKPPHWPEFPPAKAYADLYGGDAQAGREAAHLGGRLIAHELAALGVTVDCAPVLDVPQPGADPIIGDRAFGGDVDTIVALAGAFANGLMAGGVAPVIKHIPGHGRADVDSHDALPRVNVDAATLGAVDFQPFKALHALPWAMTAHVVYAALDETHPATTSPAVIEGVIRKSIGFRGLLLTDDLSMKALSGTLKDRTEASLRAGCDVALHCNGDLGEMAEVAQGAFPMTRAVWARYKMGEFHRTAATRLKFDARAARRRFDALLANG